MPARWPTAADLLPRAQKDVLAHSAFPQAHWSRIHSTNPLERLTYVVSVFPDETSMIQLVGLVLIEIGMEWQAIHYYFSQESMRKLTDPKSLLGSEPTPFRPVPGTRALRGELSTPCAWGSGKNYTID